MTPPFLAAALSVVFLCAADSASASTTHAVIVCGSKYYSNYRHQSDTFRLWSVLTSDLGVAAKNVVLLNYDDAASDPQNPYPGVLINEAGGPDVRAGVPVDYSGGDGITKDLVLDVIRGRRTTTGTRRVLESGREDRMFLYYEDHGAYDLLAFPDKSTVNSSELVSALWEMHDKGMYGSMVVFVAACLSGSVFYQAKLPPGVFVATSAPVSGLGYPTDRLPPPLSIEVSDAWPYAVNRYLSSVAGNQSTFQDMLLWVSTHMLNSSLPCTYGDLDMLHSKVLEWFGADSQTTARRETRALKGAASASYDVLDVELRSAETAFTERPTKENRARLESELSTRKWADAAFDEVRAAALGWNATVQGTLPGQLPPCTTCQGRFCDCVSCCLMHHTLQWCSFVCCDLSACSSVSPYPRSPLPHDDDFSLKVASSSSCASRLISSWHSLCSPLHDWHPYLLSVERSLLHMCRSDGHLDLPSAERAMSRLCPVPPPVPRAPLT